MRRLGNLSGAGTILVGKEEFPVNYVLSINEGLGGLKSGQGDLTGEPAHLIKVFDVNGAELKLESGDKVSIIIRHLDPLSGEAEFLVSGPIPGF